MKTAFQLLGSMLAKWRQAAVITDFIRFYPFLPSALGRLNHHYSFGKVSKASVRSLYN
jgi:hypothetical protein